MEGVRASAFCMINNHQHNKINERLGVKYIARAEVFFPPCKWKEQRNEVVENDLQKSTKSGGQHTPVEIFRPKVGTAGTGGWGQLSKNIR